MSLWGNCCWVWSQTGHFLRYRDSHRRSETLLQEWNLGKYPTCSRAGRAARPPLQCAAPRYLIERSVRSPLTEEQIAAGSRQSITIGDQLGITWIKSYYSAKDGKWYCKYEAPNADLLYEHARLGGFSIDRVYPIDVVVDPAMFR